MTKLSKWIVTRRFFIRSVCSAALLPFLAISKSGNQNSLNRSGRSNMDPIPGSLHKPANIGMHIPDLQLRFGLVTDSHYADIDPRGSRYYRESIMKIQECMELMNDHQVDFVIHLGDFKNGAPDHNMEYLRYFETLYAAFEGPRYHVLGNHDMDRISKPMFLSAVENTGIPQEMSYYSFDLKGVHFIVLDANFRTDGTPYDSGNFHWTDTSIPESQLRWLDNDLRSTRLPSIVFIHQLLDADEGSHYVKNAAAVRQVLESHASVLAVFQGHQHSGQFNRIQGIPYYTLKAMVEGSGPQNNSYAIAGIHKNGTIEITGYRRALNQQMQRMNDPLPDS